MSCFKLDMAII